MASPASGQSRVSTGNSEIDKKMGGRLPKGSVVLIEGAQDSGKSVLTQQLVWGSLREGCSVSVFTTENTVRSFLRQMDSLGLEVVDYCLLGRLKVFPTKVTKAKDGAGQALAGLLHALGGQKTRELVVVDALTSFVAHAQPQDTISFFEECKSLCGGETTLATVAHSYAFEATTLVRIGSLCDAHIRMATEKAGERIVKTLEVSKIRGAQLSTGNIITFDVEPGWGMRIIPFTKARA